MEGVAGAGGRSIVRWRLMPGQMLAHRGWQDEYVLFNNLSGDTHLLGANAIALLLDLRDQAIDSHELDTDEAAALRELLGELVRLGLVVAETAEQP
jgi:PqqD family protein of HPr-rel-A system